MTIVQATLYINSHFFNIIYHSFYSNDINNIVEKNQKIRVIVLICTGWAGGTNTHPAVD